MTGIAPALRDAAALMEAVSQTPRLDAELLMAYALDICRSELLLRQGDFEVPVGFSGLVARRLAHEPVAYIRGVQGFWDLNLRVTPDVLIPRADSETLIELAIDAFANISAPARVLDLGTGSGALLLAALSAFPDAIGLGVDASDAALVVARGNACALGFGNRTCFRHASWRDEAWSNSMDRFELILCNPPYIEDEATLAPMVAGHEPHGALFAGPQGMDDYQILMPQIPSLLAPGGFAIFEIGHTQAQAVSNLASKMGLSTEMRRDLGGNPRALRFSLGISETDG